MINALLVSRKIILSNDEKDNSPDDSGRSISKEEIERYEENVRDLEHLKRRIDKEKGENGNARPDGND